MKIPAFGRRPAIGNHPVSVIVRGTGLLFAAMAAGGPVSTALAQSDSALEEIIVTGYRGSLMNSTAAKRDSNGFSDVIFSDDIGKLPSQNLAESLNRIPGVRLNREITGEGQQISVRGLGPSFTKVALNGNSMAIASTGSLDAGNRNREVDLDMFPPELFSSLAVAKSVTAGQLEGGVSGYVNMRTARPSDYEDQHIKFSLEGAYGEISEEASPRYSLVYSNNFDNFGFLVGIAGAQNQTRVDGYEAVALFTDGCVAEWTNLPARDASGCIAGSSGLNHFFWSPEATPDYAAANPGVNVGDPVDPVATSGVSAEVLDAAKVPYLGRPMTTVGDRDRLTGLVSLEYRPREDMELVLDVMGSEASRNFVRTEAMWWGRRNFLHQGAAMIPENVTVNSNSYLTSGTFYNAHLWVGTRDYDEDLSFTAVMPSLSWQINDTLSMNLSASFTESEFDRDEPYVLYMSPGGVLNFSITGTVPSFDFNLDPAGPGIGWTWQQEFDQNQNGIIEDNERFGDMFRIQRNHRETETTGFHADFGYGEEPERNGLVFGIAWDEQSSSMTSYGGTGEFTADHVVPSDAYTNFSSYLVPSIVSDLGSNIGGYHGYDGIAQIDWARIKEATSYSSFDAVENPGDQFGSTNGDIAEEVLGLYLAGNLESEIAGRTVRLNAGVRYVDTDQNVSSLTSGTTNASYTRLLPSFNLVYDVTEAIKLRLSSSRSLTRAKPEDLFPNASWGSSGIDSVNAGNPFLSPFESTNFDLGGEWYFDEMGYVGLTYFEKDISGFTRQDTVVVPFEELPNYGMDITDIGADREQALVACGGPSVCTTNVNTRSNIEGVANLSGLELFWVMPLDFVFEGLGFNTSATHINQDASDEEAIITGVSDWTYNVTAYYEHETFQARATLFHQDGAVAGFTQGLELISFDRSQVDLAASYKLPFADNYNLNLTFDAYNVTDEPVGAWHEVEGIAFSAFYPGATYTLGLRGSF